MDWGLFDAVNVPAMPLALGVHDVSGEQGFGFRVVGLWPRKGNVWDLNRGLGRSQSSPGSNFGRWH